MKAQSTLKFCNKPLKLTKALVAAFSKHSLASSSSGQGGPSLLSQSDTDSAHPGDGAFLPHREGPWHPAQKQCEAP